jgi:ankyrin repeat protein
MAQVGEMMLGDGDVASAGFSNLSALAMSIFTCEGGLPAVLLLRDRPSVLAVAAFYGRLENFNALYDAAIALIREVYGDEAKDVISAGCVSPLIDDRGRGLPHMAAAGGNREICQRLLVDGFKFTTPDYAGRFPGEYAVRNEKLEALDWLAGEGLLRFSRSVTSHEPPVLLDAVETGSTSLVEALLNHLANLPGLNFELRESDAESKIRCERAVHVACRQGNVEILCVLLQGGARVDVLSESGLTPAVCAAKCGRRGGCDCLQVLFDAGASWKGAPLAAVRAGNLEALRELMQHLDCAKYMRDAKDDLKNVAVLLDHKAVEDYLEQLK